MIQSGIAAGEIITVLESKGGVITLDELVIRLDEPKDLIKMSLGWLIREGLVFIDERTKKFSLNRTYKMDPDYVNYAVNI